MQHVLEKHERPCGIRSMRSRRGPLLPRPPTARLTHFLHHTGNIPGQYFWASKVAKSKWFHAAKSCISSVASETMPFRHPQYGPHLVACLDSISLFEAASPCSHKKDIPAIPRIMHKASGILYRTLPSAVPPVAASGDSHLPSCGRFAAGRGGRGLIMVLPAGLSFPAYQRDFINSLTRPQDFAALRLAGRLVSEISAFDIKPITDYQ
ncbi:hypothetical protein IF1G_07406 [Cordyceps javanica]|uniref:Uncharacterized protein n=1 Tax=Cordyceps javanica TaxID=43265 RepID=A0A545VKP9_9HYPO|nr:hypothetical protein IF1G_07406 [Cordyceps javanica]TQW02313.1 hypothetical protein IF2G_10116 [Cordyceps javanica]